MTRVPPLFLLHSSGAGIQGQGGWAPYRRVCPALQMDTLHIILTSSCAGQTLEPLA